MIINGCRLLTLALRMVFRIHTAVTCDTKHGAETSLKQPPTAARGYVRQMKIFCFEFPN